MFQNTCPCGEMVDAEDSKSFAERRGGSSPSKGTKYSMRIFMKLTNIILVIKDQGPFKRFFKNFFITRNAWGLFHKNSHISQATGKPKVTYNTKKSATKAAESMSKKHGVWFSNYKCLHCDGYHIGKNRDNKYNKLAD